MAYEPNVIWTQKIGMLRRLLHQLTVSLASAFPWNSFPLDHVHFHSRLEGVLRGNGLGC